MQKTVVLLMVAALTVALAACKGGDDGAQTAADTTSGEPRAATEQLKPVFPEPEALQVVRVIDSARINSARAVRELSQNESILEYARVMLADHRAIGAIIDSTLAASSQSPADNPVSSGLRNANQQFVTDLMARDSGINNSYIMQEIGDLERALQLLDSAVIPSARSAQTRTLLEQLRPAFDGHLQRARAILAARQAAAERAAASPPPVTRTPVTTDTARLPPITTTSM